MSNVLVTPEETVELLGEIVDEHRKAAALAAAGRYLKSAEGGKLKTPADSAEKATGGAVKAKPVAKLPTGPLSTLKGTLQNMHSKAYELLRGGMPQHISSMPGPTGARG